ncbi:MAG TPA: TetR/AcrR family transcriptional regulator [Gammaproteobacteria bacterium]
MGRQPKAREIILGAARRIVRERGAGRLTYEELVQESGVTRGGITYHFPTKDDLLRELIRRDLENWTEVEAGLRPELDNELAADLIAHIRAHTERDDEHRRFASGMLSAVTLNPSMLDPIREFIDARCGDVEWTEQHLMLQILRLAAEGIFWSDVLGIGKLPDDTRDEIVRRLEQLAAEWAEPAEGQRAVS